MLLNLLFMQLAMAGYACPVGLNKSLDVVEASRFSDALMPCAGAMNLSLDTEQPSLCHAVDKADPQSADSYQLPGLLLLADLSTGFKLPRLSPEPLADLVPDAFLKRTTAPPLAVRHCCFRL